MIAIHNNYKWVVGQSYINFLLKLSYGVDSYTYLSLNFYTVNLQFC